MTSEEGQAPSSILKTESTACPLCFGVFHDKDAYVGHLKDFHKVDWKRYQALQGKQSPILPMHYYSEQGPGPRKETLPTDAAKSDINERFTTETGSSRAAGPVVPGDNDRVTQSAALVVGPTHDHDKRELDVGPVTQGEPNGPSEPVSGALPLGIIEREIDSMGLEIPPPENEGSLLEANGSHPPKLDSKEISISNHKKEDSKNVKPIGSPNLNIGDSGEHGKIRKRPETACQSPTAPQEKTGTAITRMASGTSPFSSKFHCKSVTQKSAQVSPAGVVVGANTRSKSPLAKQNRASEGTGAQITPKRAQTIPPETILGRSIIKSAPGPVRDKGISTQQVVRTRDSHHVTEPTFSSGRDESSFSDSDNAISICSTVLPQDSEYNDHVMDGVEDEEGDSFPILYNPVLPQLENRGAVANFLKSKENDKATEWSFWGSTPKPTTQPENSSIGTKSEDSVGTTLDHQIKPKAKQGQEKFQDSTASQSKASLVPMGQREGIGSGPHKQNEEDRPYQHIAVFATEDGRLTPRPPDLEGTRRWGNELGNSWLQGKSKTTPDFMDSSKAPIHLEYPGKERSDPRVPKSFLNRLGELDDHNGRSIDTRTPESSLVGGQLPVALRCPTCCRFHMGDDCGEAPAGCIICGGRHWVKQCDAAAKAIASTFRPGISCNRCGMMHKNMCPSRTACPVCLRIHTGLCLKPSGTCRYCGAQHWENGCPRWVALDEETGFSSVNSHTTRTVKKMSDLVMRRFGCGKYFGSLNNRDGGPNRQYEAPKYPFNPMEIRTIPDMLNYLNDQDARRCLPPTYSNAKAIKRDANSILRGKGGFVFDPTQFDSDGCFSGGERGAKYHQRTASNHPRDRESSPPFYQPERLDHYGEYAQYGDLRSHWDYQCALKRGWSGAKSRPQEQGSDLHMSDYADLCARRSRRGEHRGRAETVKEEGLEPARERDRGQKQGRELDTERERWEEKKKLERVSLGSRSNSREYHKRALSTSSNRYREGDYDGPKRRGESESLSKRRRHE